MLATPPRLGLEISPRGKSTCSAAHLQDQPFPNGCNPSSILRQLTYHTFAPILVVVSVLISLYLTSLLSPLIFVSPRSPLGRMTTDGDNAVFLQRCQECHELVQAFLNDTLPWGPVPLRHSMYQFDPAVRELTKANIRKSMRELEGAFENLSDIAMSYNGGKDCLVMLILILATLHQRRDTLPQDFRLDSVYINSEIPFSQMTEFINWSNKHYGLHLVPIKAALKEGFEQYLAERPAIKRVIIGIRHTDPYGSQLQFEQCTDGDWPRFTRVHPMLDWQYVEIWDFLVGTDVRYCSMYDDGYTSLGGRDNTMPNPHLKAPEGAGVDYLPAYMLTDDADAHERLGRMKKVVH